MPAGRVSTFGHAVQTANTWVHTYTARFAKEANTANQDVPRAAAATSTAISHHVVPGQTTRTFDQLPTDIRTLVEPRAPH